MNIGYIIYSTIQMVKKKILKERCYFTHTDQEGIPQGNLYETLYIDQKKREKK